MKIFIPTYKRTRKQRTWDGLPTFLKENTFLVCGEEEREEHEKEGRQVLVHPEGMHRVAPKRQWIVENCREEKILMLDDDLSFRCRIEGGYKLRDMGEEDFKKMIDRMERELDNYGAVGLSSQAGNNRSFPKDILSPSRMFTAYSLRTDILISNGIRFDDMEVMEDFHVTLSLLRKGIPNAVLQDWCWSQPKSNAEGGCSEYRTFEVQKKAAEELARIHSPYVQVVKKESKSWGNGLETRYDVRVSWKKAYEDSRGEEG
jgi:hypothetical protein